MVERSICIREAPGSIPGFSTSFHSVERVKVSSKHSSMRGIIGQPALISARHRRVHYFNIISVRPSSVSAHRFNSIIRKRQPAQVVRTSGFEQGVLGSMHGLGIYFHTDYKSSVTSLPSNHVTMNGTILIQ